MERVRLREVAALAGVSVGLASAVLNGRPVRARPETVARILEAVRVLGYRPDPLARGMRLGRTGVLALVVPNLTNPYYPSLALAAQRAAWERGLEVLVYANPTEDLAQVARAAAARRVDGGLLVVSHYRREDLLAHLPPDLPWVGIGHAEGPLPFDQVVFRDREAAREAVLYLAGRGKGRIAHLSGPQSSPTARARLRGYWEGVRALGLPGRVAEGNFRYGGNEKALEALLDWGADALLAANDLMALEALTFLHDRGVRVPQEVAVVGFDGIPMTEWVRPRLTTVLRPPEAPARAALERLEARLSGEEGPPRVVRLTPRLLTRESA
ncbi:LacI family transcriptional regulator (plasmid) [Thermus thermophilus]|uniref:LacI family DNA-binding transcriptional regulator n=1 Tax=Thermus thermophilus TaxID=274 RepID=UPI001FCD8140|nr:LacI family DNA-binding transcriptional regulator [Thermus thermophilus]BDG20186.1 LacI family transcriptional regulator [Thermus thermophilus]